MENQVRHFLELKHVREGRKSDLKRAVNHKSEIVTDLVLWFWMRVKVQLC